MRAFGYRLASSAEHAVRTVAGTRGATYVAGGTDLLNLMKDSVQVPEHLVDVRDTGLADIVTDGSALRIGGLASLRQVADHPEVKRSVPVLSEALFASASPQIRNMATIGGNLLQRTRCGYFRDPGSACNKREPGSGCPAIAGRHRSHAILGGSQQCIATHPSDLAVALLALEATVRVLGPDGDREIPIGEFYRLPGATPDQEHALRPGELITAVEVTHTPTARHSRYVKLRDRASFEFAVVSVAAALRLRGRVVQDVRLAFGGVGTRPWRDRRVEDALHDRPLTRATIVDAGRELVRDAASGAENRFKIELVQQALASVLADLGGIK